jgi:hypothetical protein
MKLEPIAEITNQSFTQNEEFFSEDLRIYNRAKMIFLNMSTTSSKAIQLTFDSGSNWVDLADAKKFYFNELFQFPMDTPERLNFRATSAGGATVQHLHIYAEYSGIR